MPELSRRYAAEAGGGASGGWAEILALARAPGVTDLGQGFPDWEGSPEARAAASAAISDPASARSNQYSPIPGSAGLKAAISEYYTASWPGMPLGRALDPASEVVVTTSGTEAIMAFMLAALDPGDGVIVFEPAFPWYGPLARLCGAEVAAVRLAPVGGFAMEEAALRAAVGPRTKMVIFNTPHNPTGHVATEEEVAMVSRVCVEHDLLCLADEAYEDQVFGGATHRRIAGSPGMWERTLTVATASKLLSLTGWRVGWAVGPPSLVAATVAMHSYATFCAPSPLQEGVAEALRRERERICKGEETGVAAAAREIGGNVRVLSEAFESIGLRPHPPQGGYFLVVELPPGAPGDMEFCKRMIVEAKVACMPLSKFYGAAAGAGGAGAAAPVNMLRVAVCKRRATAEEAAGKLRAWRWRRREEGGEPPE